MITTSTRPTWATPGANLILTADASREEWLQARTQGIGGSDVSAIVGLNKWSSPYQVWLDKTGNAAEKETNQAMRMGNLLEPIVVQLFNEDAGIETRRIGLLRSKENPFMQVTPDRLTADGGLLECKTSNGWLRSEWEDDQVPDHAELQLQHALYVADKPHGYVAGLLDGREFFVRRVERDDKLIGQLIEIERRFWEQYVLTGEAPAVTRLDLGTLKDRYAQAAPESSVTSDRATLTALRAEYESARDNETAAAKAKDEAASRIRDLLGENEAAKDEDGTTWLTLKQNGAFSASRFEKDHPEIASEYTITKPALDTKKLQADHPELHQKYRSRVLRLPKIKTT